MAILLQDDFNRADSATVIGSPLVGPAPATIGGAWGISSNQAYTATAGSMVVWECGTMDVDISVSFPNPGPSSTSFNVVLGQTAAGSADCWVVNFVNVVGTPSTISKNVAGTIIYFENFYVGGLIPTGGVCRVLHKGGVLHVYLGASLVWAGDLPEPLRGTRHGLRTSVVATRFDDLVIQDAGVAAVPSSTGADLPADPVDAIADTSSFLYRGRDTKTQDIAGGS